MKKITLYNRTSLTIVCDKNNLVMFNSLQWSCSKYPMHVYTVRISYKDYSKLRPVSYKDHLLQVPKSWFQCYSRYCYKDLHAIMTTFCWSLIISDTSAKIDKVLAGLRNLTKYQNYLTITNTCSHCSKSVNSYRTCIKAHSWHSW